MTEYEYRIVLETLDGTVIPLLSQGPGLDGARERLQDLLNSTPRYVKGWLERRKPSSWEKFSHAYVSERAPDD